MLQNKEVRHLSNTQVLSVTHDRFQVKLVVLSALIETQQYVIIVICYICAKVNQNVCDQNVNK